MKIGEKFKIPEEYCGHTGEIIGVSNDGKTIYVQCHKEHKVDPLRKEPYGEKTVWDWKGERYIKKLIKKKDIVYVFDVSDKS